MLQTIKRFFASALALALALSLFPSLNTTAAAQYSGTCGANLNWNLDTVTGVLDISGTGDMDDYYYDYGKQRNTSPWAVYESDIRTVNIASGVTGIGAWAFEDCSNMTSAALPPSVTRIGERAFLNCTSLASAAIPVGVTSIGTWAFGGCSSLTSVFIPSSVSDIGDSAFGVCANLTSATFEGDAPNSLGNDVFNNAANGFTIYHYPGKTGWPSVSPGTWNGYSTEMLGSAPSFVPVTSITGVPNSATANLPLTLSVTVNPSDATNKTITWSVVNPGTTAASITGNTINTAAPGTITIRATIVNGTASNTNYTQDFIISVNAAPILDTQYTVLLLDVSSSMSQSALSVMKRSAINFCETLLQDAVSCGNIKNYIALVSFCSSSIIEQVFTDDIDILKSKINTLSLRGATNYNPALLDAQTLLNGINTNGVIKNVILISDSAPNDSAAAKNTARAMIDDGCNIYTLGFFHSGLDFNAESILKDIQNKGYYFVDDVNELDQLFGKLRSDICGLSSASDTERYAVLVLDMSGSMAGTPLEELKTASKKFCESMMKADGANYISIVTYDSKGEMVCDFTDDLNKLYSAIGSLTESGLTNMNSGLTIAGELMDGIAGGPNVIKNIILMSDGLPTWGTEFKIGGKYTARDYDYYSYANSVYQTTQTLKLKGYNIYTLGFYHSTVQNTEWKRNLQTLYFAIRFMNDLQSHGAYIIRDTKKLDIAFGYIGSSILDTTAQRVLIKIECPVDFTVSYERETLSSHLDIDFISLLTSWGKIDFTNDELSKKAVTLYTSKPVEIAIYGTGEGSMNFSVDTCDPFGNLSSRNSIVGVPVKNGTRINTEVDKYADPILLYDFNGNGNAEEIALPQGGAEAEELPSYWAQADVSRAIRSNLVPYNLRSKYTQVMSRAEFCALAVTLYEMFLGSEIKGRVSFTDTNDINVEKAGAVGIVVGVGDGRFNPSAGLTREQAATILARLSNALGQPLPGYTASFDDNPDISPWAIDSVGQVQHAGIMQGVGGNAFSPRTQYTREQSITTILRLYDRVI